MNAIRMTAFLACAGLVVAGCATTRKVSAPEKRQSVLEEAEKILSTATKSDPSIQGAIDQAPGYAVFSYRVFKIPIVLGGFGGGGGYGVLMEKPGDEKTFMRVRKAEWGWGMGTREVGLILIFQDRDAIERFKRGYRRLMAGGEVTAKPGGVGGDLGANQATGRGFTAYSVTQRGASYGITVRSQKFFVDKKLKE